MSSIPSIREPMTDGVLALRLFGERDIPEILIAHQDDPELHLRLGLDRPPSGAELGRQAERAPAEREAGRSVRLTVLQHGSDTCVGRILVHGIDWTHSHADLGMWLAPQVRGRGLAPRALRLATRWLLEDCGLQRVQLMTEPSNQPMIRAAQAAGFAEEGVLRDYAFYGGQRVDFVVLSILTGDLAA
jgi:RimJ/RimL family protein N-acetyltransferase